MDKESLQKMTVAELREEAKKIPDATGLSSMKKDELVELILAGAGAGAAPAAKGKPASGRKSAGKKGGPPDRSALKERIQALKKDKREALAGDDRARAQECNREIHRCKRMLRKMARDKR